MSLRSESQLDPFTILYNHRKSSKLQNLSKTARRRHHDYSTLPHSIIITRRMAARLEHTNQPHEEQSLLLRPQTE